MASHPYDIALGSRVRFRRKELGVSQGALARVCGIAVQQIQKYEHGSNRIGFSRLAQIATALECSIADLTSGIGKSKRASAQEARLGIVGATDLLRAYMSIKSQKQRHALLKCARELVRDQGA